MNNPLYSLCLSSNRPQNWDRLYRSFNSECKTISFEIIVTGPYSPSHILPSNFKYIHTENIKPAQGFEIAFRNASGDFIGNAADDFLLYNLRLDDLYKEYQDLCDQEGNDKVMVIPPFFFGSEEHNTPYHRGDASSPLTSMDGCFVKREWFDEIGYLDRNFLGVYWDIDWCMRFYEFGGKIFRSKTSLTQEIPQDTEARLHRRTKMIDRTTLDSFWVRNRMEYEEVPSKTNWCYYGDDGKVVSKFRNCPYEPFCSDGITEKSQGLPRIGRLLLWE